MKLRITHSYNVITGPSSSGAINDLVIDCPNDIDDEPELVSNNSSFKCPQQDMLECYPGHTRCFTRIEKCIYNLTKETQFLMYCRNGQHLQDCENASCSSTFKCPMSYCIPYRYLCNGRWDCWNGDDELLCQNYTCAGMIKCRNARMCLHIDNTCDGYPDCPTGEDEIICTGKVCVEDCVCLNHGIHCENLVNQEKVIPIIFKYIFINISNSNTAHVSLQVIGDPLIYVSSKCGLKYLLLCESTNILHLKLLDLSCNTVRTLTSETLQCLPDLVQMILKQNQIEILANSPFQHQGNLEMLDFDENQIYFLGKCAFCGLSKLKLLRIIKNPIKQAKLDIFKTSFVHLVLTHNFHICCMLSTPNTHCTAEPMWPFSCDALLSHLGLKISGWLIGSIIILSNLASILKTVSVFHTECNLNECQKLVFSINTCDFLTGIHILGIIIKDLTTGNNYIGNDLAWRSSFFCHALAGLSLLSVLLSANCLFFISISRYWVLKNPLAKLKGDTTYSFIRISFYPAIAIVSLVALLLFARYSLEGKHNLSSPLCVLLGNTQESTAEKVITLTTPIYFMIIFLLILTVYYRMLKKSADSTQILDDKKKKERQKALTIHVVVAGVTNVLCWGLSSLFFFISVFVHSFPVILLYLMTLVVLPINCMLNPYIFHLSEIKKLFFVIRKFCKHSEEVK